MTKDDSIREQNMDAGERIDLLDHPLFAALAAYRDALAARDGIALCEMHRAENGERIPRFVAQTPELLADGLHYEERIARLGVIATREGCAHDLFNALIWLSHPALKRAMNSRQVADIARVGRKQRTRGQCALTHFDEAGAIVWLAGSELVDAWDAHDWRALFVRHRDAWGSQIALTVIGHALFEYALENGEMPVAKALAIRVDETEIAARNHDASIPGWTCAERWIAQAIASGRLLADPQELRPLPLAGIPGWHAGEQSDTFYATAPCFRPLRPDRRYPVPLTIADQAGVAALEAACEHAATG
jgi:hypothetical protein